MLTASSDHCSFDAELPLSGNKTSVKEVDFIWSWQWDKFSYISRVGRLTNEGMFTACRQRQHILLTLCLSHTRPHINSVIHKSALKDSKPQSHTVEIPANYFS